MWDTKRIPLIYSTLPSSTTVDTRARAAASPSLPSERLPVTPTVAKDNVRGPGLGHNFAKVGLQAPFQAKLSVSQPDDQYEREADQVADAVMRTPEAGAPAIAAPHAVRSGLVARSAGNKITPLVQRQENTEPESPEEREETDLTDSAPLQRQTQSETGEEEDGEREADETSANTPAGGSPVQRQADTQETEEEEDTEEPLQARRGGQAPSVTTGVEAQLHRTQGQGASLPSSARAFFEPRFGHDFSQVRIHADADAASANRSLNAQAFTRGRDIYFGAGRYQPQSASGRQLLAHELTHVVQQGAAGAHTPMVQREEEIPGFTPEEVEEHAEPHTEPKEETGEAAREAAGVKAGPSINSPGVMACTPLSPATQYLRKLPTPDKGSNVLATLNFNDIVFVEQSGGAGNQWYQIMTASGEQGWVPAASVALDPPEPGAQLYRVKVGDTPIDLAGAWYGPFERWWWPGSKGEGDARFYVAALAFANKGRAGMPSPANLGSVSSWKSVTLVSGNTVWKPSKSFLDTLKGKVSSGSITRELWEGVKTAAKIVWGWIVYAAAFIAGIFYGAGESIYDLFAGVVEIFKMVYEIGRSLINGTFISDAQALWEDLKKISLSDLGEWFLSQWNAEDPWDCGFFRGRVIGYVAMEIIMLVFSGGILTAIKWVGKFAKIGELIAKLPRIAKLIEAAKAAKLPAKAKAFLKARLAGKAAEGAKVLKALEKGKPAIEAYLKTAEHIAKRTTAYGEYVARGGKKSKAVFEAMYDTLTRNRKVGALAEESFKTIMGGAPKSYWVKVGGKDVLRMVDNVLGNVAREVKSGPLKLTPFIKKQILKDIELIKTKGLQVEWHLLAGGDASAIGALQKAGIKVIIY